MLLSTSPKPPFIHPNDIPQPSQYPHSFILLKKLIQRPQNGLKWVCLGGRQEIGGSGGVGGDIEEEYYRLPSSQNGGISICGAQNGVKWVCFGGRQRIDGSGGVFLGGVGGDIQEDYCRKPRAQNGHKLARNGVKPLLAIRGSAGRGGGFFLGGVDRDIDGDGEECRILRVQNGLMSIPGPLNGVKSAQNGRKGVCFAFRERGNMFSGGVDRDTEKEGYRKARAEKGVISIPGPQYGVKPARNSVKPLFATREGGRGGSVILGGVDRPIEEKGYRKARPRNNAKPMFAIREGRRGGVFLGAIDRAIEGEEYRKARAEVNRKGLDVDGYMVEGVSIGGHETCIVVPRLNLSFDIGRCYVRAVNQDYLFITHAHLDHIGGLPMYVATRGLYGLKPPTVFVPPCIKEDVEKLFELHRKMSQVDLDFELIALDIGDTYELRNDIVVRPFRTHHVIPSQGYVAYSVRKKLKKQYTHLNGKQIEKLKFSGVEITNTILSPEVAFTGDTTSEFFLDPRSADALRAKVLITEATFLDEGFSVKQARQLGHTHLFEIMEHAEWIRNNTLLLTHFSSRYKIEDIREAVLKLQPKVSAKVVALTEGFKSMNT